MNHLPSEINDYVTEELGEVTKLSSVSGGCINNGHCVDTSKGQFFLKWNSARRFPDMFNLEQKGLELLRKAEAIKIPEPLYCYEGDEYSCLILEWITSAPKQANYSEQLGRKLAALHQHTGDQYGLDHNNYIGSLPQYNEFENDWLDFFINKRLKPQLDLALKSGKMNQHDEALFEKLFEQFPDLLVVENPALTHGDLWSGNVMTGENGEPVLIDPAVAYTHREVDLAFTTLFGGFDQVFYQSYHEAFPLEAGYRERLDIYNLYPLLVHVNLFGGGYYHQVMSIVQRFI